MNVIPEVIIIHATSLSESTGEIIYINYSNDEFDISNEDDGSIGFCDGTITTVTDSEWVVE